MAQNLLYLSNKGVTTNDVKCSKYKDRIIKDALLRLSKSLAILASSHIYYRKILNETNCEINSRQESKK